MMQKHTVKSGKLSVEFCSACQLRCVECSTSKGVVENGAVGTGYLTEDSFRAILEQCDQLRAVEGSNWGEIFLNPELVPIMAYAHCQGVRLTAGNGVNFNDVSEDVLNALVKYEFAYLNISIDGASQGTYEQYRVGGNFSQVMRNIDRLNDLKRKHNTDRPRLAWQFIVFGHNEHEISKAQQLSLEKDMIFSPRLNHSDFSPIRDHDQVKNDTGLNATTRSEYLRKYGYHYKRPCCQLWHSPQVNWDGKLLGCCVNKWGDYGNVLNDGLDVCIKGHNYAVAKASLEGKEAPLSGLPCLKCPTFNTVLASPITKDERTRYDAFIHPAETEPIKTHSAIAAQATQSHVVRSLP